MGSHVSPFVANLYMELFEPRAIKSAINLSRLWKRYVDNKTKKTEEQKTEETKVEAITKQSRSAT